MTKDQMFRRKVTADDTFTVTTNVTREQKNHIKFSYLNVISCS